MGFPYPGHLRTVVRRTVPIWVLGRPLLLLLLFLATRDPAVALHPTPATRVVLVGVTSLLVWWDRKRAHELLLQANLGANPGWFWAASLLTATGADVTFQALLALA
jgi:hypothetical protein